MASSGNALIHWVSLADVLIVLQARCSASDYY
jgi:hypothetical protein